MNKSKKIRKYELELVPIHWNTFLLIIIFLGLIASTILISIYCGILLVAYFGVLNWDASKLLFFKQKRTIYLHSNFLKVAETGQVIQLQKIGWFRVDKRFGSPTMNFLLKEKGKLFPTSFATLESSPFYQNWVGFKKTTLRRVKQVNPKSLPWSATTIGKITKVFWLIMILLLLGIIIYESPYLFFGVVLFLVYIVGKSFREK